MVTIVPNWPEVGVMLEIWLGGDLAWGVVVPHVVARDDCTSVTDKLDLAVASVERFRCGYHDDGIADDLEVRGNLNPTKGDAGVQSTTAKEV
jgi:hypothetical protein